MSITGQTGYVALAKQTGFGTPNTTLADYRAVKITGDSLVAANNMLVAEGEIGTGRDVTQAVQGGFSAAGAVNGNLRASAASTFLYGALGAGSVTTGPPVTDAFAPNDTLPLFTVEKKVGSSSRTANELLTLRYTDTMVNTLNISAPSGGLATYSAGLIATGEKYLDPAGAAGSVPVITGQPTYAATADDLLVFHGGRVLAADTGASLTQNDNFQSVEVVINNNVQADEYTVRPSRFLRSLTEGIRSIELNITLVFNDYHDYLKYTYGASANTTPGYSLYMGALQLFLGNWQIASGETITTSPGTNLPTNPQAVQLTLPKLAFSGLPVTLATGRIAVSTTARGLKPTAGNIVDAIVRPTAAGIPTTEY